MVTKAVEIVGRTNGKTNSVTFRPDGLHLVAADTAGCLREWRADNGQEVIPSAMTARGNIYSAAASMDGRWIVSGDLGNKVIVWNAVTHQIAIEISKHTSYVYAVDVSNDSTRIASGSGDRTARIFNTISGFEVIPPLQHSGEVVGVKFSPDGSKIATATHLQTPVRIYDAYTGNTLFDIQVQIAWAPITPLAWSLDTKHLFIGTSGKITSHDSSTSSLSELPIPHGDTNVSIVIHGQFITCSSGSSVSFWDSISRQQIGSIINHTAVVNCISVSHDGVYLACGHDHGITVHSLANFLPSSYLRGFRVSRVPLIQLSEAVLESWRLGNQANTESIISEEIVQLLDPCSYVFAARSLVRAHLEKWEMAIEDAEMSLKIKQSPIGQIAKSFALAGAGEQDAALVDFDLAFRDCETNDNILLLVIKSVFVFVCSKQNEAVSRLSSLIRSSNENVKSHYIQVLGNMYLKQGDYENAVKTLEGVQSPSGPQDADPLVTVSLIFNWHFDRLESIAWERLCETLYASGRTKEVGETLLRMVSSLVEDEKERTHGRILEQIVTRSGEATLLAWTGRSSTCNSCLPSSPAVYSQHPFVSPCVEDELKKRTSELQAVLPSADALVVYGRLTRLQPVRFAHFRLLLPCIVFGVKGLKKGEGNIYRARTIGLGNVEIMTTDSLPLKEPRRLVFVDTRIHALNSAPSAGTVWDEPESDSESNPDTNMRNSADTDADNLAQALLIEEVPFTPTDAYTHTLQIVAQLEQPFSALLLLRQSDGTYKRVAADHEIVARWAENYVAKDIRVEVLEIL